MEKIIKRVEELKKTKKNFRELERCSSSFLKKNFDKRNGYGTLLKENESYQKNGEDWIENAKNKKKEAEISIKNGLPNALFLYIESVLNYGQGFMELKKQTSVNWIYLIDLIKFIISKNKNIKNKEAVYYLNLLLILVEKKTTEILLEEVYNKRKKEGEKAEVDSKISLALNLNKEQITQTEELKRKIKPNIFSKEEINPFDCGFSSLNKIIKKKD